MRSSSWMTHKISSDGGGSSRIIVRERNRVKSTIRFSARLTTLSGVKHHPSLISLYLLLCWRNQLFRSMRFMNLSSLFSIACFASITVEKSRSEKRKKGKREMWKRWIIEYNGKAAWWWLKKKKTPKSFRSRRHEYHNYFNLQLHHSFSGKQEKDTKLLLRHLISLATEQTRRKMFFVVFNKQRVIKLGLCRNKSFFIQPALKRDH